MSFSGSSVVCPVDRVMVNEYKVRLTAFGVFLLSVLYLVFPNWIMPLVLVWDFYSRAFFQSQYSPLNALAGWLEERNWLGQKPIDRAPKKFAAGIGFILVDLQLIAMAVGLTNWAMGLAGTLVFFSFLEWALGFCAGCQVYALMKKTGLA